MYVRRTKARAAIQEICCRNEGVVTNLEDEGHTICFIGPTKVFELIESYQLPEGITLQVERRPAGSDPDDAEAEGVLESFAYYGSD